MNALYRPGPMEMIGDFIARKHGQQKISYPHPKLEPILKETYGVIVYQEQVMKIASEIGGLSLAKADLMRRAMGKKDAKLMADMKKEFVDGAVRLDVPEEVRGRDLRPHREVREVRLQQVAQRRVFGHRLSDRLSEGALSGRVHGRNADVRDRGYGQDRSADRRLPEGRHPGAPAGYQRKREGLHGRSAARSVSASWRSRTSAGAPSRPWLLRAPRTGRSRMSMTSAAAPTSGW